MVKLPPFVFLQFDFQIDFISGSKHDADDEIACRPNEVRTSNNHGLEFKRRPSPAKSGAELTLFYLF